MFKLPITFIDFDGKEKTKDFYFNLTKGEIAEINFAIPGGLDGFMEKLKDEPEVSDIIEVFKMIITKSYGKRTADNSFIKSKKISEEFSATDAYSELFLKFIDNEDDFVNKFLEGAITAPAGAIREIIQNSKNVEPIQEAEEVQGVD